MNVYFDNAATTPLRNEVIKTISRVMEECFGNPSSNHSFGRKAKNLIEEGKKSRKRRLTEAGTAEAGTSTGEIAGLIM